MPKLSHPRIEKGHAVAFLLDLYRNERAFVEELGQLRMPYAELLAQLAVSQAKFGINCRQLLPPEKFQETLHYFYYDYALRRDKVPELPAELADQLEEMQQMWQEIQPYLGGLLELAFRWKLRAPWAVIVLVQYDIWGIWQDMGMPKEIDIPLYAFDNLYPWPPLMQPLEIKVSSWCFMFYGRDQIMAEIARQLKSYEEKIEALGIKQYPSRLSRHAKWWFEHYVHNMAYDKIAQAEVYTPSGSLISHARNVGTAVRRFSRLIEIDPKALKK